MSIHTPEEIELEEDFANAFRVATSLAMMLQQLDEIADSSDEHDQIDCCLFQARELNKRLDVIYEKTNCYRHVPKPNGENGESANG